MKIYLTMATEMINHVHIEVIRKGADLGDLTIGVYSDSILERLGRVPYMTESERMSVFRAISGVKDVVLEDDFHFTKNLQTIKPDIVIRGSKHTATDKKIQETISAWGGKILEIPFTKGVVVDEFFRKISKQGYLPEVRRRKLNYYFKNKPLIRIIEAHNGITGLIAEKTAITTNGRTKTFHGMWVSSLCDSTAKGKPDIELVDHSSRLATIQEILDVTTKPIILDGDSGGLTEHFVHNIKSIERAGVSAIIIEDKIGLKKNSLFGDVGQNQDDIKSFCEKITAGKKARSSQDFSIIARIESLILNKGQEDAIERAKAYIQAGADGIMIHSAKTSPNEIFEFCDEYVKFGNVPLVAVPSTYNTVTEDELEKRGVKVVIYANHLIRSAFPAMLKTARLILENGRSAEADELCMPIKEILTLIPE
ncbi:MAG: phosphoenolpyruvate mutase [Turicibacter sp.]|nr:phosphoenolpyruvate mutase [Turicibacter sp.]